MSEKKNEVFLLPEGRLINANLFEKDAFNDKATPVYNIEIAFDPDDIEPILDALAACAVEKWGEDAGQDDALWRESPELGEFMVPLLDGNKLKAKREAKNKPGEAYEDKIVLRAHTIYNKDGIDAPGGTDVYDEDVKEVGAANRGVVYNGCLGRAGVTFSGYLTDGGDKALTCYLSAFQKTGDGERLISAADHSKLFSPVGKKGKGDSKKGSRRRRAE